MFERYTETARRALFFARYEVTTSGGLTIEPEHLVLGVLRDAPDAVLRFADAGTSVHALQAALASSLPADKPAERVEIPFSHDCKTALEAARVEADAARNHFITPEHLIAGVLASTAGSAMRALAEAGVTLEAIREFVREQPEAAHPPMTSHAAGYVVRQWKGVVKPGRDGDYLRHLREETLPSLQRLAGFVSATVLRRDVDDGVEFEVMTAWRSLDAIKAFAGDDVTMAVVPPAAQAMMLRFDDRAVHYTVAL